MTEGALVADLGADGRAAMRRQCVNSRLDPSFARRIATQPLWCS
jgi:hypothetical protein